MVWLDREPCSLKENPFQAKFRCQAGAAEQAVPGLVLLLHLHPLHLQAGVHGKKEGFVFIPFLRPMPHNILRWGRPPRGDQDTYFERFSLASFLQKLVYIRETQTGQSSTSTREGFILRGRRESFIWDEIKQSETRMHLGLLLLLLPPLSLQCGISTHTEVGFRWIVFLSKCIWYIYHP